MTTTGDAYASIDVAEGAVVTPGAGGSWSWPVNITVYGKPVLHIPPSAGGGVTPYDEYCFRVTYSTSHIDAVEELQDSANGGFELAQDRDYQEPAEAEYSAELDAYNARIEERTRISAANEQLAEGEPQQELPPLLPKPEPPAFPLPLCEGSPGEIPDFTPAFLAAADALESITAPTLHIAPGHGITGLDGYLETGRTMAFTNGRTWYPQLGWDLTNDPLNPSAISGHVDFEGAGSYVVDWADGTISPPQTTPGVAYGQPGVPVTHSYVDTGVYPIVVTDTWRVKMDVEFLGETYTFIHEETLVPWAYPGGFRVEEVRSQRDS